MMVRILDLLISTIVLVLILDLDRDGHIHEGWSLAMV